MKLSEAANSFSRLSGDYGLLSQQDLLDRDPSKWNIALRTPLPKCDKVHMGRVLVTAAIPKEVREA
jgi:hypothetical protein